MKKKITSRIQFLQKFLIALIGAITFAVICAEESSAQSGAGMPDQFTFKTGITYDITSGKSDDAQKIQDMTLWFAEGDYVGIEMGAQKMMFMVYDLKSMKMLTLMEAQQMAMVMDMKKMGQDVATAAGEKEVPDVKITKTNIKEDILGYSCDQYKVTSETTESLVWLTTQLGADFGNFAKSMGIAMGGMKGNKKTGSFPDMKGMAKGAMLKVEAKDASTGDMTRIEATAVNKEGKTINTSGYKVMNMPGQ
ncbi:MAG TPA: DUF4412 domain-containing protein [Agriterribacter sp.]|nr:DUF4412 domain-containing protein [Agriterribacter sp.]